MLILLGIFVVLKNFGLVSGSLFFSGWWTVFIIVPSLVNLVFNHNKLWDASLLIFGVCLFLAANELYLTYSNAWAIGLCLLLVNIGITVMVGNKNKRKRQGVLAAKDNYIAVLSSCREKPEQFGGGKAVAVLGGVSLDLCDLDFKGDVYLTAVSVFGGIDIITNDNINVVFNTVNVFGSNDNYQPSISGNPTLYISGCSVFGGIDVKVKK